MREIKADADMLPPTITLDHVKYLDDLMAEMFASTSYDKVSPEFMEETQEEVERVDRELD